MGVLAAAFIALASPACSRNLLKPDFDLPARTSPAALALANLDALPPASRYELFTLYQAYIEAVNTRRAQHWHTNLLSGEIVEHPDEPLLPARQLEEALAKREAEVKLLETKVKQERLNRPVPPPKEPNIVDWSEPPEESGPKPTEAELALKAKRKELKIARRKLSRSKGISLDWSDAVWAALTKLGVEHWSVFDQARTAAPRHTAAVVCTPAEDPLTCVVFDPWKTGEPDAYEIRSWDQGSFADRLPPDYFLHNLPDKP
ncbi:MAG: hypothetical protein HY077_02365 [Elusimicrobia bacterium]|nr:hypothetical protein [Elusimicrobiota bacterium]